jgi:hypothetical protein
MTDFPINITDSKHAFKEATKQAGEISHYEKCIVYVYRVMEGGYVLDNLFREYSNEKLIATYFKGEKK